MTIKDVPERPDVERTLRTGYPRKFDYPRCPMCGRACRTVYRTAGGEIAGCNECVRGEDAWDAEECFEED